MSDRTGSGRNLLFAPIDSAGASGNITIVPAPAANLQIKIVTLMLTAQNPNDIVLQSGLTNKLTGSISLQTAGSNVLSVQGIPEGHVLECSLGQAFIINLSNTNQVGGHISYFLEGAVVHA